MNLSMRSHVNSNLLDSTWKGGSKWILFIASAILTCFGGAMAVVTPENERTVIALGTVGGIGLGGLIVVGVL
jgi:hypothetical protein